jgi:putative MFS transporter
MKNQENVHWGKISLIFSKWAQLKKFILSTLIGIPIWYVAGILMAFSPEISRALNIEGDVKASRTIAIGYLGLALGDLLCGLTSQLLKKRILAVQIFMLISIFFIFGQLYFSENSTAKEYYVWSFLIGVGAGFWAVFVTIGAEQFGTNIRATVATTIPNLVRGAVIPITLSFQFFKEQYDILTSTIVVGAIVFFIAGVSSLLLPETFNKDLDYIETKD